MKKLSSYICMSFCLLIVSASAYGQDFKKMREILVEKQKDTRSEIETLTNQINKYEDRLQKADQKYEVLYGQYKDLQHLIALQNDKLSKLDKEQSQVQQEINVTSQLINQNQQKLDQLVEKYKKTLRYLYMQGRTSHAALILSSASINQMLVRAYYLKKFNTFRENQAQEIHQAKQELEKTKKQLESAKAKNGNVLDEIRTEKSRLRYKQDQQQRNVDLLKRNRQEIQARLQEVQRQKNKFDKMLTALSQKEDRVRAAQEARIQQQEQKRKQKLAKARTISDAEKRAQAVEKYSKPTANQNFMDSEELKEVEKNFAKSKGELPWPVKNRTISEHFGNRRHPVYGTVTPNPGIEIVTDPQASVRAVYEGYVIDVRPIPGFGDVVVLKHGRFISAYGNLSQIMVRKNQILQQGDLIGLSGDKDSAKGESLFFLLREGSSNLDPEKWLNTEAVSEAMTTN